MIRYVGVCESEELREVFRAGDRDLTPHELSIVNITKWLTNLR